MKTIYTDNQMFQYLIFIGNMIRRRKIMIVAIFIVTFMPATLILVTKPIKHTAMAKVLITQHARVNVELSGSLSERASRSIIPVERLNSMAELLKSNEIIEKMMNELDIEEQKNDGKNQDAENDDLLKRYKSEIQAHVLPATNVIEVSYADTDPEKAKKVVTKLIDAFKTVYRRIAEGDGTLEFYRAHLLQIKERLYSNQKRLNELKTKEGIMVDYSLVRKNVYQRLETLRNERDDLSKRKTQIITEIKKLNNELSLQPKYLQGSVEKIMNPNLFEMEKKLTTLEIERSALLTKYTDHSREVMDKAEEIESITKKMENQSPMIDGKSIMVLNQLHTRLQEDIIQSKTELSGLNTKFKMLEHEIETHEREITRLNILTPQFVDLENMVNSDKKMYHFYLGKLDDARFIAAMNQQHITSLEVIESPKRAIANRKPIVKKGLATLCLSLLLSFGIALIFELLRPRLNQPEQVQNLTRLPVLGTISRKAA